jgi:hypothetical protein
MARVGARAYMGSGSFAPVGFRGKAPGQWVRGAKPLKLTIY